MENNQPRKKNAGVTALIAMLLIITTLASCIGLYAWAKYITNKNGRATVDVAKWNFNLSLRAGQNTVTTPTQTLDLATTTYQNLANDRIAPGTSGEFDIVINTQGTEVSLNYDVTIAITDCPRNITFSRQQGTDALTLETVSAGGTDTFARTIHFSKYVSVANASGEFVEKIKWNWPYEGGNDTWDTQDQAKTTRLAITVVGTEALSEPSAAETPGTVAYAATHASTSGMARWQSVNYTPGTASISNDTLSVAGASLIGNTKVASIAGASLNGIISTEDADNWVILDFDQTTGEVKIIPREYSSTELYLEGMDGYNNAIQALDEVASIYKNDAYATSSKSLTVDDVNKVEGYDPTEVASGSVSATASGNGEVSYSWNHRYGMDENLNIVDYGEGNVGERTYVKTPATGYYDYNTENFSNWRCWLASRCVNLDSGNCDFRVRGLGYGGVYDGGNYLFDVPSGGDAYDGGSGNPVVPVVTLKSTVHMEKVNDVWQLSL